MHAFDGCAVYIQMYIFVVERERGGMHACVLCGEEVCMHVLKKYSFALYAFQIVEHRLHALCR